MILVCALATAAGVVLLATPVCAADHAAVVNGTPIPRSAVREIVKSVIAARGELPNSADLDALTTAALDSLIDLELLFQEGRRRGLDVSDAAVEKEVEKLKSSFADARSFAAALERGGIDEKQLRHDTRKTLVTRRLLEEVVWRDVHIEADAIDTFYRENRVALEKSAAPRIRHILVRVPHGSPPVERERALLRIRMLRQRALAGEDFAELARTNSDDAESARSGGVITDPPPLLATAAQSLSVGETSEVIETADGYHLVQLAEAPAPAGTPSADTREQIRALLLDEARRKQEAAFVAELRKNAVIVYPPSAAEDATPDAQPSPEAGGETDAVTPSPPGGSTGADSPAPR